MDTAAPEREEGIFVDEEGERIREMAVMTKTATSLRIITIKPSGYDKQLVQYIEDDKK